MSVPEDPHDMVDNWLGDMVGDAGIEEVKGVMHRYQRLMGADSMTGIDNLGRTWRFTVEMFESYKLQRGQKVVIETDGVVGRVYSEHHMMAGVYVVTTNLEGADDGLYQRIVRRDLLECLPDNEQERNEYLERMG